eukprot:comp20223_c0_seq2/m.25186 comp20223_c0_seq2/g.25186  ORF comp20223_c0_seq2/g.25186 comp20223_c0_seq2/m.25186 type:complete len:585 (+) comp20223_c0_seq2:500-2254(+)
MAHQRQVVGAEELLFDLLLEVLGHWCPGKTLGVCLADNSGGDLLSACLDLLNVGIGLAHLDVLLGERLTQCAGSNVQHRVGDNAGLGNGRGQTERREDVHVVALGRVVSLAVDGNGGEGAAGGHNGLALSPPEGLLGRALALGRGVGHGADEWAVAILGHLPNNLLGECVGGGGKTQKHSGLHTLDDFQKVKTVLHVVTAEQHLLLICALLGHKTLHVKHPEVLAGLLTSHALVDHAVCDGIKHTHTGGAGTQAHHTLLLDGSAGQTTNAQVREHAGKGNSTRTLNVIIEHQFVVAIALEQCMCILRHEILELHHHTGPAGGDGVNKLVHQAEELRPLDAGVGATNVQRVVKKFGVVCAEVELDGQHTAGVHTTAGNVQRQLADGDTHALATQVTQTQNAGAIRHTDDINLVGMPVVDHRVHGTLVVRAEVHATCAAVECRELLACLSHGGGVDERGDACKVVHDHLVEECLVAVHKGHQCEILLDVGLAVGKRLVHALLLSFERKLCGRQQTAQAHALTLGNCVCRPLVEEGLVNEGVSVEIRQPNLFIAVQNPLPRGRGSSMKGTAPETSSNGRGGLRHASG